MPCRSLRKVDGIIGDMMQALPDDNATAVALRTYFNKQNHNKVISFVPFPVKENIQVLHLKMGNIN